MKKRGVEVVHVDRILGDPITEFVGLAVAEPSLGAAAGNPDGKGILVVVSTGLGHLAIAVLTLPERRAAELGGPDDQSLVEQATLCKSAIRAAIGRSTCLVLAAICVKTLPCASQPWSKSWTNRTPRSTSRRANKQLLAKLVWPGSVP